MNSNINTFQTVILKYVKILCERYYSAQDKNLKIQPKNGFQLFMYNH